jgi:predicted kinase
MCKTLILLRGIPASGKSTLAKALQDSQGAQVASADSFWYDSAGVYRFDPKKLPEAHERCQETVKEYMRDYERKLIVVDNCNLAESHRAPYVKLAEEYGYDVQVVTVNTPLEVCLKRNSERTADRRVPEGTICKLANEYNLG